MSITAEEKIAKIKEILDLDGPEDACDNMQGAIIDIFHVHPKGFADTICENTLKRVLGQLGSVMNILEK